MLVIDSKLIGKSFVIANRNRDGLLKRSDNLGHVIVTFDDDGISTKEVRPFASKKLATSLGQLAEICLDIDKQAVLQYLVSPEMEIERIFNCLRYKYLQAVQLSKVTNVNRRAKMTHF